MGPSLCFATDAMGTPTAVGQMSDVVLIYFFLTWSVIHFHDQWLLAFLGNEYVLNVTYFTFTVILRPILVVNTISNI